MKTKDLDPESRWPHDVLSAPICLLIVELIIMVELGIPLAVVIIAASAIFALFILPRVFDKMQEMGIK